MRGIIIALFCFFPMLFSNIAHSAMILKIKGRKALVDLEGVPAKKGDKFDALNLYGKPLGVIEIKKVKKGKAIGVLIKGKMGVSWILEPAFQGSDSGGDTSDTEYDPVEKPLSGSSNTSSSSSDSSAGIFRQTNYSNGFGILLGGNFNMLNTSASKSIAGWSMQGDIFMDFTLHDPLGMRIFVGYRQLKAVGNNCGLNRCNLLVHYPGVGLFLRGVFLKHLMFQPWVGGGGFMFWPLVDKQADLGLHKKSFSSFHGSLTGALGVDVHFGGMYIPIQVDFNWINLFVLSVSRLKEGSREFKPFYIGARLGFGFSF